MQPPCTSAAVTRWVLSRRGPRVDLGHRRALGASLPSTDVEDIADHAQHIDPLGTPLFGYIGTIDWRSEAVSEDRDEALRSLLRRADGQLAERASDPTWLFRARNARLLGTLIGGASVATYAGFLETAEPEPPVGLLPSLYEQVDEVSLDDLLDGLRPDIFGELAVLDELGRARVHGLAANEVVNLAWRNGPHRLPGFRRTSSPRSP